VVRRVDIVLPDSAPIEFVGEAPVGVGQTAMALSRDGRILVYVGGGARPRLYVRPLDRFEATPLAGTEGAYGPFLSPDGAWIGFFADNQLKKVPVGGGPVSILADAPLSTGAAWSEKGSIVFLTSSGSELYQVSADGGRATTIARPPSGSLKTIMYLPGEHWLLCTMYADEGFYAIAARSTEGPEVRVLVRQGPAKSWRDGTPFPEDALLGATPSYDTNGALLFTRPDGSLVSVGFDLEDLETHGEPVILALGVRRESWTGHGQISLGGDGTLAYAPGSNSDVGVLAWLDRGGRLDTLPFPPAYSLGTDVAPDGGRIAVTIPAISGSLELWVYDLRNGVRQRLLTGLCDSEIRWTPDGMGILACLSAAGVVRIDPARPGKVDTLARNRLTPASVSKDGRRLLLGSPLSDSSFLLSLDGRSAPEQIKFTTEDGAFQPAFSPDGRWISYLGRNGGVYVEPYPITGEVYRISNQLEGDVPTWPTSNEIVFPSGSQLYVVKVYPGPVPRFDPPRILATQRLANLSGRPYAVADDGRRFLIKLPTPEHSARSIRLMVNRHE
jgi:Tol biopolymer transport system component